MDEEDIKNRLWKAEDQVVNLEAEVLDLEEKLQTYEEQSLEYQTDVELLRNQVATMTVKIEGHDHELSELTQLKDVAEADLTTCESDKEDFEMEIERLTEIEEKYDMLIEEADNDR